MSNGLGRRLKLETAALHTEVERTGVMAWLLRGELSREDYCRLLANLHALYSALEAGLSRHADDPRVAPVCLAELFRTRALAADLDALAGEQCAVTLPLAKAARGYVQRLHTLADTAPPLLAAHAYVRYLGDLHGGQVLARIVGRSIGPAARRGLSFYDFGAPEHVAKLRAAFRAGLEQLPADEASVNALAGEAALAFRMHRDLFSELAGDDPCVSGSGCRQAPLNS